MPDHPPQTSHYKEPLCGRVHLSQFQADLLWRPETTIQASYGISLTAAVINRLQRIWCNWCLSKPTKMHLYKSSVLSVLLYAMETWTLLATDPGSFSHAMSTIGIWWFDKITSVIVLSITGLSTMESILNNCQMSLFNHVVWLPPGEPTNQILDLQVHSVKNRPPHPGWKRPRGRPRKLWLKHVFNKPLSDLWTNAINIGHRAMQRPEVAMRPWWWCKCKGAWLISCFRLNVLCHRNSAFIGLGYIRCLIAIHNLMFEMHLTAWIRSWLTPEGKQDE